VERSNINNLILHFKELEKEQNEPKFSKSKKITRTRAQINEIEARKQKDQQN
jgi:hypothetical protein